MPTLNDVLAGSLAQAVQVQQIIDALKGTPNKGVPIALVSLNDPNNYALTVQNDDPVNSRALSVLKADGTTLISADATGVTLGAPVNMPVSSLPGTTLTNGSVTNQKLASDTARMSLLVNGGLDVWQRGSGPFSGNGTWTADRWTISLGGGSSLSVAKDTTNQDAGSQACAALTYTHSALTLFQQPVAFAADDGLINQLRGKTISFSARVRTATANAVQISVFGSVLGRVTGTTHPGTGTYQTLSVSATLPTNETNLEVEIGLLASCTAYVDNAMLVVGSQYADYAPLHPADDLARCQRYYELIGNPGDQSVIIAGYQPTGGAAIYTSFQLKTEKAITPAVTLVPTWTYANASGASAGIQGSRTLRLQATITAAGYGYALNSGVGSLVTVEANP
jgi:hypothetical protein